MTCQSAYSAEREIQDYKLAKRQLTQRQDAEGLLNLDSDLLNAQQQECNHASGRDAEQVGRLVQREGHQCQPCNQETGGVPASSQLSV